jgi:hypothetical protein
MYLSHKIDRMLRASYFQMELLYQTSDGATVRKILAPWSSRADIRIVHRER